MSSRPGQSHVEVSHTHNSLLGLGTRLLDFISLIVKESPNKSWRGQEPASVFFLVTHFFAHASCAVLVLLKMGRRRIWKKKSLFMFAPPRCTALHVPVQKTSARRPRTRQRHANLVKKEQHRNALPFQRSQVKSTCCVTESRIT